MELRRAGQDDAAAVRALVLAAYAKWVPLIGRKPRPMEADYDAAVRAHEIDMLYEAGDLVGLIEMEVRPDCLWIENVAVDPAQQGRGHGRFLLAHAEARARAAGRTELRLLTNQAFAANIALYERVGYRITATEPWAGGTTVYMAKTL